MGLVFLSYFDVPRKKNVIYIRGSFIFQISAAKHARMRSSQKWYCCWLYSLHYFFLYEMGVTF